MTRHLGQIGRTISRLVVAAHVDTLPGEWRSPGSECTAGRAEPQQDRRENCSRDAAGLQQYLSEVAPKRWGDETRTKRLKIFAFCYSHWLVDPKLRAKTDKSYISTFVVWELWRKTDTCGYPRSSRAVFYKIEAKTGAFKESESQGGFLSINERMKVNTVSQYST